MDDSDQDFVDLCSKLLKRVRKKPEEPKQPSRKAEHHQPTSQPGGDKRRKPCKRDGDSGSKVTSSQPVSAAGSGHESGDAGSSVGPSAAAGPRADGGPNAKDKVLLRMQQFKRSSPRRMVHEDKIQPTNQDDGDDCPPLVQQQTREAPDSLGSDRPAEPLDGDEALALRLQQELDSEAARVRTVDLEDRGLFFCQICSRDLSHMTPEGRTQHINRCLDDSEESAPAPLPPPPPAPSGVADCPICGKKFKSQKSRSAHLKRCSSAMGISPAVLLQVLQRQAEENQSAAAAAANTHVQGTKRKGPTKPGLPASKKPRKKTEPVDEETMVALALSSSLLEQETQQQRQMEALRRLQTETRSSMTLNRRAVAGKGRGKRKKGAAPRPPPLLLCQDAQSALTRLQERVSALLLCSRAPSPPTPTRSPSALPGRSGAAPLWQKSTLQDRGSTSLSDFYAPEIRELFMAVESVTTDAASFQPESSVQPVTEGTPVPGTSASIPPSSPKTASCSTALSSPGTGQLLVGSQALRDLMDLAEDGMTLTQWGYTAKDKQFDLRLSGFVQEESEEQENLCVSGFLPETAHTHSRSQAMRTSDQPGADGDRDRDRGRGSNQSVALSRLASDLSSMVNNPQLSDLQLQVDAGEVFFAHSFMVYARCPLLAEMVHESGFGVQEAGAPAAQRVLLSDVPGQAVLAVLQYLYTASCSIPASLQPHVLELASRFDLQELQQLCQLHREEADRTNQEENSSRTDQAFMELLQSMWNEEDENDDAAYSDGGTDEGRRLVEDPRADEVTAEIHDEKVNEEELEEIYEFAATQRKKEEKDSEEEEEEDEEKEEEDEVGETVFTKLTEPKSKKNPQPNFQLEPDRSPDRSYDRLFSAPWGVYEEGEPSSSASAPPETRPPQVQQHRAHKPSSELSGGPLLQSSASAVEDLSLSPPPCASSPPVPGRSPGRAGHPDGDEGEDDAEDEAPLTRESKGPARICVPLSPDSPRTKIEPELIVLSDSSEEAETEVRVDVLSSGTPSPQRSYTEVKTRQSRTPKEPSSENTVSSSVEFRPAEPPDWSPEVSWLIPSAPVQSRSSRSSSTQTKSSMCRTQLFAASPPSSSVFSSPALPFKNMPHVSKSPTGVCAHGVSRLKADSAAALRGSDPKLSPKKRSNSDREVVDVPPSQPETRPRSLPRSLRASSTEDLHPPPPSYSSTPLHPQLHRPPGRPAASPLHADRDRHQSQRRERAPSESPEKTELGSFRLSPLSDPSDPPSSSSSPGRHLQSSRRRSESFGQSRRSVESGGRDTAGLDSTRRGVGKEEGKRDAGCDGKDSGDEEQEEEKGETGEGEVAECSFRQSFTDEPPIAFNDSWGLDAACVQAGPGCFSPRLEDSGQSSQPERNPGQPETGRSSSSSIPQPPPQTRRRGATTPPPPEGHVTRPGRTGPSPPDLDSRTTPEINNDLLDSKIWDSWEEEDEEEALPLSQRVNPSAQLKTPTTSHNKRRRTLVPITPVPHYSDMDTPELKNKLNRFGVRPLPKRQMILKLKEIHQYTHQLVSSEEEEEEEAPAAVRAAQTKPPPSRPVSGAQSAEFKEPRAAAAAAPGKHTGEEEAEPLSNSQGSNTSSTAASEESERSNPELCVSSSSSDDEDEDAAGISSSQAAHRLRDRLQAVRSFILSDAGLYGQILEYRPLVLSQLQERLRAAGIRLGAAKLVDYLDSQCITFTTAKPGNSAPGRRRGKRTARAAGGKKGVAALI
ncbi:structure-specific endonuclease subunit SLX4 isoform X1 [Embiotoca jacksoni]|uniref:structure-specific endonuclease subunit SLX4 isoform X1 n=1 Tax=Embiotoca jacksoni TaxID=100190 RepID=UPI003704B584